MSHRCPEGKSHSLFCRAGSKGESIGSQGGVMERIEKDKGNKSMHSAAGGEGGWRRGKD